jgi:hypothetical protein
MEKVPANSNPLRPPFVFGSVITDLYHAAHNKEIAGVSFTLGMKPIALSQIQVNFFSFSAANLFLGDEGRDKAFPREK